MPYRRARWWWLAGVSALALWSIAEANAEDLTGNVSGPIIRADGEAVSLRNLGNVTWVRPRYGSLSPLIQVETLGDAATFIQDGTLKIVDPKGSSNRGVLISLESVGGTTTAAGPADGAGGPVTLRMLKPVNTRGQDYSIARATSTGWKGASGGSVVVEIANGADLSQSVSGLSAIFARSEGGFGNTDSGGGGSGGDGGRVTLSNRATITTTGNTSPALTAQSIGGNGANSTKGSGGAGGSGGSVAITNSGAIKTSGTSSVGILGQSSGGTGGKGSDGWFSGAPGGSAGHGGTVTITNANSGTIATQGELASGIVALSLGGGGAKNALALQSSAGGSVIGGLLGAGGDGGTGGDGGNVIVLNDGAIETLGASAYGILAESVGGSGGAGGRANSAGSLFSLTLGGSGGGGGNGGDVTVGYQLSASSSAAGGWQPTSITTTGENATALFAQSVGGGGGVGGAASTKTLGTVATVAIAVGGSGGKGGKGGAVAVNNRATLTTYGDAASGIVARSIGGGGGAGGQTTADAFGFTPASPGADAAVSVAVGGSGGAGGAGGLVTVMNAAKTIVTYGSSATGIDAASVGGGGGSSGAAASYALAMSAGASVSLSLSTSVGGSGGGGGAGGDVNVTNGANAGIITWGTDSIGLRAMSIGGGGGAVSQASSLSNVLGFYKNIAASASFGGSGGSGGKGGNVDVTQRGWITTYGQFSPGLVALSVGGGGGYGGTADTAASAGLTTSLTVNKQISSFIDILPVADTITANLAIGGSGGGGGDGGDVIVKDLGTIATAGSNSAAVQAVSVGGGGGVAGGFQGGGEGSLAANLSLGGKGGNGGNGGAVTVSILNYPAASIKTMSSGSAGISAISVGGGGGAGGSFTGKRESAAPGWPTNFASWDTVKFVTSLTNELLKANKAISKNVEKSYPYFGKQSKMQDWAKGVKSVMVTAKTLAEANNLEGIDGLKVFLSVAATSGQLALTKAAKALEAKGNWSLPSAALNLALGGSGGNGGNGGAVTVSNAGSVATSGDISAAVLAQSIGGGGGYGGAAYATGNNILNANVTIGATGGKGGKGGEVQVTNAGTISTEGAVSTGVLAQSVGGGGGLGGASTQANTMSYSGRFVLGGSGGTSGDGGAVTVLNSGRISTKGQEAHGIMAQSVGGGGGVYYMNTYNTYTTTTLSAEMKAAYAAVEAFLLTIAKKTNTTLPSTAGATVDSSTTILPVPSMNVTLGGSGGVGGNGGTVKVENTGEISTSGIGSFGIFAQSVGGGGGAGTNGAGEGSLSVNVALGGTGGAAGNGGSVNVTLGSGSSITTTGDGAIALFAQSIGGGGGYGGVGRLSASRATLNLTRGSGSSGNGGEIAVEYGDTAISTTGKRAHGIYAQSLGGGGGFVTDLSGSQIVKSNTAAVSNVTGSGGRISILPENYLSSAVRPQAYISATGEDSYGIFAQSGQQKADGTLADNGTGSSINIFYSGTITGGAGAGAAIRSDTTALTRIELYKGSVIQALSGTAITTPFGTTQITNWGTVIGDVSINSGYFNNEAGGIYQSRSKHGVLNLSGKGFLNGGTFDIGGVGNVARAVLSGSYVGTSGSALLVDIAADKATYVDEFDVKDGSVKFDANSSVRLNVTSLLPKYTYTVMQVTGGDIVGSLPTVTGVSATSPITWSVEKTSTSADTELKLTARADFTHPQGVALSQEQDAVAKELQGAWDASDKDFAHMFGQLAGVSATDYAATLNGLSPDDNANEVSSSAMETRAALKAAMSCPTFVDNTTLIHESDCLWARIIGGRATMSSSAMDDGFTQNAMTYRVGGQHEVMENWFLGFSAGWTQGWMSESGGGSSSSSNTFNGAVALKYQTGSWLFALSAALGNTWQDNIRTIAIGSSSATAKSHSQLLDAGLKLRGAYEFSFADWYLRPYVDIDGLYIDQGAYSEQGAPGFNLDVSSAQKGLFAVNPSLELGGRVNLEQGYWLRPFASIGYTWLSSGIFTSTSRFQDAPISLGTFETKTRIPNNLLDVGLGLQVTSGQGLDLTAEYQAQIANNYLAQFGSLKLAVHF